MEFLYKPSYTSICDLFKYKDITDSTESKKVLSDLFGTEHILKGWIRFVRKQSNLTFVQMHDGSHSSAIQLIFDEKNSTILDKVKNQLYIGTTIQVKGTVVKSPASGQDLEVYVIDMDILGPIEDPSNYLPCQKKTTFEQLRKIQHLRPKFKSFGSIYRIRSKLLQLVHEYFHNRQFSLIDPNIVTTSDCEGGGEVFTITNLLKDGEKSKVPTIKESIELTKGDVKNITTNDTDKIDFSQDFFSKQAFLTVSSQLQLEALCSGMGRVYTTNPSFRAEPSKTKRHLCCFTHIEWEMPFIDLKDLMDFSEDFVTYCFKGILKHCKHDLQELDSFVAKGLIAKLESFVKERFARVTYDEAIDILKKNEIDVLNKFKDEGLTQLPKWGDDLGSYCERYLSEYVFKKPVFVHHYPKDLKSFYMKQEAPYTVTLDDGTVEHRQCVQSVDCLIPQLGELIGASIRESDYTTLVTEIKKRKMDLTPLQWYVDLRKDATFPHGGAGLGFDRLVSICTSQGGNIREAVPFPISYQECYY